MGWSDGWRLNLDGDHLDVSPGQEKHHARIGLHRSVTARWLSTAAAAVCRAPPGAIRRHERREHLQGPAERRARFDDRADGQFRRSSLRSRTRTLPEATTSRDSRDRQLRAVTDSRVSADGQQGAIKQSRSTRMRRRMRHYNAIIYGGGRI